MKKCIFFPILILVAILSATSLPELSDLPSLDLEQLRFGTAETLDIVTWNIQNFPKAGDTTIVYVGNILLAIDADIYAMQEIQCDSSFVVLTNYLNSLDKENKWIGYRATSDSWDMNLAYIYKAEISDFAVFYEIFPEENEENSYAFPRRPLIMKFFYENEEIFVINNHLKARGTDRDKARRRRAVERLDDFITTYLNHNQVLVLGDLNDQLTRPAEENVFTIFLEKDDEYRFANYELAADPDADWSYPYWKFRGYIDHILITNELFDHFENVKTIVIDRYLEGGNDARYQMIGDHRPVGARFLFK
jgi:endonuclease/exonuclease/phosphatase family metal-dependent hydrolase